MSNHLKKGTPHLQEHIPLALEPINEQLLDRILNMGFDLLVDPGIKIHNQEALSLLQKAGANVDFDEQIASIPQSIVHSALETAPSQFTLYDLVGNPVVIYGGDNVQFDPGSTAVTILEDRNGNQRPPTTNDFVKFVKLVETLPQIDAQSTALVCSDVPSEISDLYRLYLALNYMTKPIITGAFRKDTFLTMWEMLVAVSGGQDNLSTRPIAVFDVCPTPPLQWSDDTCQNLIDCAMKGIPAELVSMPLAGITSPVSLISSVVQHTAETLSGITIGQVAKPGSPIVWGGAPSAFDMRSGTTPMGDVGTWLIDYAYIQVGKRLNLPTHTYMGSSDAKLLDLQCGLESSAGTLLAALSRVNMISGAGMIDFLRCQSLEKLVIDAEIISMTKRLTSGIATQDLDLTFNLMRKSAHQANHLSSKHTRRNYRNELYIHSDIIDHDSLEEWQSKGSKSTFDRAVEQVEALLSSYQPSTLSPHLRSELRVITTKKAKSIGLDELPPLPSE